MGETKQRVTDAELASILGDTREHGTFQRVLARDLTDAREALRIAETALVQATRDHEIEDEERCPVCFALTTVRAARGSNIITDTMVAAVMNDEPYDDSEYGRAHALLKLADIALAAATKRAEDAERERDEAYARGLALRARTENEHHPNQRESKL